MRRSRTDGPEFPEPPSLDGFAKGDLVTTIDDPRVYRLTGLVAEAVPGSGQLPMVQVTVAVSNIGNLFDLPKWKSVICLRKVSQLEPATEASA